VSGFLLDTNVVSELVKPRPEAKVAAWVEGTSESLLYLSVLTFGEIRRGIESLGHTSRRVALETWLSGELTVRFAGRILAIDWMIANRWGSLATRAARGGALLPVIDGLLAATAAHHNLTLVTRNTRDVAAAGVSVFNPWIE
jgi:predicted nucleic acid-binding protein